MTNAALISGLLIAGAAGALRAQSSASDPVPKGMIRIDGSKNPELIPQWLLWRESFRNWAVKDEVSPMFWDRLKTLTPAETDLLYRESVAQLERDQQLWTKLAAEQKRLQDLREQPAAAKRILDDIEIEWRWTVLEARDRVLAGLTPEAQSMLVNEVDRNRPGISAFMPKEDLDQFKRPQ